MLVAAGITVPDTLPQSSKPIRNTQPSNRRATRSSTSRVLSSIVSPKKSSTAVISSQATHRKPRTESFICPICFDDSPDLIPLSLDCDHLFCNNCWSAYLTSKISDEGELSIRCMAETCALVAPDTFVQSVLSSSSDPTAATTLERFRKLTVRHFVSSNPQLKYCPYPGCTNTVSCPAAASKVVLTTLVPTVSCGARGVISDAPSTRNSAFSGGKESSILSKEHKFCFGCAIDSDHQPLICSVAKMWLQKCRDDSETANWIKSNTKECSNCQSTIEKNGGCKSVVRPFDLAFRADVSQPYDVQEM